ncbi:hypothetical protein PTI98_005245 [Pleurotus ostreatus]|nr:hypothetical protein PTI98_005245 [Pleurotus ostreatus]
MDPLYESQAQFTISLLPVSLSLVHIPRSRLTQLSHPVLRLILQPKPAFLNITCNEIELSLFAEHQMLEDFELLARRDRQRQRARSGSTASRKSSSSSLVEPVEMSYERWNVLQIDSHSDALENAGSRVNELSAPLAAAGISILYQSSYMSDFIFVKESRLHEVMSLLAQAGFDLYSATQDPWTLSPTSHDINAMVDMSTTTILTKSRSSMDITSSTCTSPKSQSPERTRPSLQRQKSHSPTNVDIDVLDPDLACVGLSEENIDIWSLKIVKLVAFPDLIHSCRKSSTPAPISKAGQYSALFGAPYSSLSPTSLDSPLSSYSTSSDEEGYFSQSPKDGNYSNGSLTSASRSYTDLSNLMPNTSPLKSASKHVVPSAPLDAHKLSNSLISFKKDSSVSFFSFTRTSEGSSLTLDVSLLATLFPPQERFMVICSGEFDALSESELDDQDWDAPSTTHKCLQIDLRRFGLDKHGLVNRFSRVLEENHINHMYSSTFKTANLLVDKRHALRAQSLLRAC